MLSEDEIIGPLDLLVNTSCSAITGQTLIADEDGQYGRKAYRNYPCSRWLEAHTAKYHRFLRKTYDRLDY